MVFSARLLKFGELRNRDLFDPALLHPFILACAVQQQCVELQVIARCCRQRLYAWVKPCEMLVFDGWRFFGRRVARQQ